MVNEIITTSCCWTSLHHGNWLAAPTAVNMAMYENPGDMKGYNISFLIVAMITLLVTIVKDFLKDSYL